jgi:hypothetical protein
VISRRWSLALLGYVLGLALLALALYAAAKASLPALTEAHWRQVERGMTREQVEGLLGEPQRTFRAGQDVAEGLDEGFPTTTESISFWTGADAPFSGAFVGFDARGRAVHTRAIPLPPGLDTEWEKWRRWLFYF